MNKPLRRFGLAVCVLCLGLAAKSALAAERAYAVVDGVQMPAWVEHGGIRQPLEPGRVLKNRDRVITGADARVLIQLAEGSTVRLGENAQLDLNALGRRENKVFTAALDVAKGAVRFSTGAASKQRQQRAVNVRIATITASVRGTDLWGKSDDLGDRICLVEGRITVVHPQGEAQEMHEPMSAYVAPKSAAPLAVAPVDALQFGQWTAETDLQSDTGHTRRGGRWSLELATVDSQEQALELYDRARAAGYAVRIKPKAGAGGSYRYALRVTQLPSKQEAMILGSKLIGLFELDAPLALRN